MSTPSFIRANPIDDRNLLISMSVEYMSWVMAEVERNYGLTPQEVFGKTVPEYVISVIDKVCGDPPPRGILYLIKVDTEIAGMCGLRYLQDGVAEIKRLYVRPEYRGMNIGELALQRLLSDAREFGYQKVYIDTATFMKSAHRLYGAHGFVDCDPYEGVEVPAAFHSIWRFMTRSLID